MTDVVGYARVSTLEQAEQGLSLPAQRQRIADYCNFHDLRLVKTLVDAGISGKRTANRPSVQRVIEMVRRKEVCGVVICKLDRFARSTKEAIEFAELCKKRGVVLHSITEKLDTSTAMGEFFYTMLAAFAQMESRKNGERTAEVLRLKRERGEKTGGGVPFGYDSKVVAGTKVLIPNEAEQKTLTLFQKYRAKGWSIRRIGAHLERRGVKTKNGKQKWSPSTVHKLLNADRSVHVGTNVNSKQGKKSKKKARKA